jgi:hypothetical protein
MQQIKIFKSENAEKHEKLVNDFLSELKAIIKVEHFIENQVARSDSKYIQCGYFITIIHYSLYKS